MTFIDSNVLIYVADDTDAEKQRIARSVVEQAISSDDFLVSAQVLNEFTSVLLKKLRKSSACSRFRRARCAVWGL